MCWEKMKRFLLLTLGILGAIILAFVVTKMARSGMSLDMSGEPQSGRNEQSQQSSESSHRQFEWGHATMIQGDPPSETKFRERQGAKEQAKNRLERRRNDIIETIEEYENAGMGADHPLVVRATDDLLRILAEQAGTGQSATRPE